LGPLPFPLDVQTPGTKFCGQQRAGRQKAFSSSFFFFSFCGQGKVSAEKEVWPEKTVTHFFLFLSLLFLEKSRGRKEEKRRFGQEAGSLMSFPPPPPSLLRSGRSSEKGAKVSKRPFLLPFFFFLLQPHLQKRFFLARFFLSFFFPSSTSPENQLNHRNPFDTPPSPSFSRQEIDFLRSPPPLMEVLRKVSARRFLFFGPAGSFGSEIRRSTKSDPVLPSVVRKKHASFPSTFFPGRRDIF